MSLEGLFTHASIVERAIAPEVAARVRAPLSFERYALFDRGSYEHTAYREPGLLKIVCELAGAELGRTLSPVGARVVRLRAGDYVLARHDEVQTRLANALVAEPAGDTRASQHYELVLDLSPAPVPAEIHYRRRGQVFFRMPCTPCSLAIVERTAAISCNHTYVSKLVPEPEVVRLVVQAVG